MTKILIDRSTVEQALGALEAGPDVDPIFAGETADALRVALAEPTTAQQVVSEQAEDEGLWFVAATASEAYLQRALRRLHAAVEGEDDQEQALADADRIMGHDDESTEWRERWAHLFSCALTYGGYQCSCGANQRNAK